MIQRLGGLPWRRLLTAALAAIAVILYWTNFADRNEHRAVRDAAPVTAGQPTTTHAAATKSWGAGVGFADTRRLDEHFEKHGSEFGRITKQDYLRQAQLLRDTAVGGSVLETVRRDGVATRFDRQTGAFLAFNPNGVIRTFFKPNDGERYYRRQAERGSE